MLYTPVYTFQYILVFNLKKRNKKLQKSNWVTALLKHYYLTYGSELTWPIALFNSYKI